MAGKDRPDDFAQRRTRLADLSDEALEQRFWGLLDQIVRPLVDEARTHTTPSIERSVLLRMGFSSIESGKLVDQFGRRGLLGHGAGRLVLELARSEGASVRQAGEALLGGALWEKLPL